MRTALKSAVSRAWRDYEDIRQTTRRRVGIWGSGRIPDRRAFRTPGRLQSGSLKLQNTVRGNETRLFVRERVGKIFLYPQIKLICSPLFSPPSSSTCGTHGVRLLAGPSLHPHPLSSAPTPLCSAPTRNSRTPFSGSAAPSSPPAPSSPQPAAHAATSRCCARRQSPRPLMVPGSRPDRVRVRSPPYQLQTRRALPASLPLVCCCR